MWEKLKKSAFSKNWVHARGSQILKPFKWIKDFLHLFFIYPIQKPIVPLDSSSSETPSSYQVSKLAKETQELGLRI